MATDYTPFVDQTADKYGVPRWLARAMYYKESKSGRDVRTSPKGAKGHMQLMPDTARAMGVKDINDPRQNIEGAVKYISTLLARFGGDPAMAAAAYNYGPTRLAKLNGRLPNNKETREYVTYVQASNPNPGARVPIPPKPEPNMAKPASSNGNVQLKDVRIVGERKGNRVVAKPSLLDEAKRGSGLATRSMIEGLAEGAGVILDPIQFFLNKAYSAVGVPQNLIPQLPSQMGRQAANRLDLPKPQTGLERVLVETGKFVSPVAGQQLLVRGGQRLAQTGLTAAQRALAARAAPSVTQRVARQAIANPATQAVAAATAGAASGAVGELTDQNPYAKLGAAVIGGAAGARGMGRIENAINDVLTPEGRDAIRQRAAAEAQGITVTAADVYPGSRFTRGLTTLLESMPGSGMRTLREQNAQARAAVEALRNRARPYNIGEDATPKELGVRLIKDLRDQYKAAKGQAGALYDAVLPALNKKKGTDQIAVSNAKTAITNFLTEFPDYLRDPDVPTSVKDLMRKIGNIDPKTNKPIPVDPKKPVTDTTQVIGYNDFRKMNTAFGQAYSEAERAAAASGKGGSKTAALGEVYSSLSRDADAWVSRLEQQNPEAATAFRQAQSYFTENVLPFRDTKLVNDVVGRRLKPTEIDNTGEKFITSLLNADEGTAQTAMRLSSENGQQVARFALLDKAAKSSISDQSVSEVTPMRAFGAIDPSDPTNAAILGTDPEILAQTTQLSEALSAARRSTEAFSNPRTGAQLLPYAQGAGLIGAGYLAQQNQIPEEYQGLALLTALAAGRGASAALARPGAVRLMAGQTPELITNPALLNPAMLSIANLARPTEIAPVSALPKPPAAGALTPQQEQEILQSEAFQYLTAPEEVNYTTGESIVTPSSNVTIDLDPKSIKTINPDELPEDF